MNDADSAPVAVAKPGHWIAQGMRSALFLPPDLRKLRATPGLLAALCLLLLAFGIGAQRLAIPGDAVFYWQAIASGWVGTVATLWACWLVAHGRSPENDSAPAVSTLFGVLLAQTWVIAATVWLAYLMLGAMGHSPTVRWAMWWLTPLTLLWTLAASIRLLWPQTVVRTGPRLAMLVALCGSTALGAVAPPAGYWYADSSSGADKDASPKFEVTQEVFEAQATAFDRQLAALAPQRSGVVDLYALTVAPYADADVFVRESAMVAEVMRTRFDAQGRVMQLVNNARTAGELPWATPINVKRAIEGIASRMNRDEDVLFVHFTSHGARNGTLSAGFWPLRVDGIKPAQLKEWLDTAGIRFRVISVSACYSGSWLEPLRDEHTLVMTAADADHTSYGCGRLSELTYFGRAVFDEQLRQTRSFEAAHAAARPVIAQREKQAGKTDGYSNPQIHVGAEVRRQLAALESRLKTAEGH